MMGCLRSSWPGTPLAPLILSFNQETTMATQTPNRDADQQKREGPASDPGNRPGGSHPGGNPGTKEGGNTNPTVGHPGVTKPVKSDPEQP